MSPGTAVTAQGRLRAPLWLLTGLVLIGLGAAAAVAPLALIAVLGALGVVAALAWATAHRPALIAVIVVVGFTLQPAGKFFISPLLGPAKDVVVLTALVVTLVVMAIRPTWRAADGWIDVVALSLMAVYIINVAGSHGPGWAAATRLTVGSVGLLLVAYHNRDPARTWRVASSAMIWTAVVESILGIAQQALGTRRLVEQFGYLSGEQVRETASGLLRSFGTLDEPFTYAPLLLVALVIATQTQPRALRNVWLAPLLVVGTVLSFDRTAIALLVVVGALWLLRLGPRSALGFLLLGLTLVGLGLGAHAVATSVAQGTGGSFLTTLNGRTQTWSHVVRGPGDLLAGRGAGTIGSGLARSKAALIVASGRYRPGYAPTPASNEDLTSIDNSYLAVLADIGLPGVMLVLALGVLVLARVLVRGLDYSPGWCVLGIVAVIAVDSLTRTSLTAFPFGYISLYLVGVGLAEVDRHATSVV